MLKLMTAGSLILMGATNSHACVWEGPTGAKEAVDWVFRDKGAKGNFDYALDCPTQEHRGPEHCQGLLGALKYAQRHADNSVRDNMDACASKIEEYMKAGRR